MHFISTWQIVIGNQILKTNNCNNLSLGHIVLSVINLNLHCKATVVNFSGPKFYLIFITRVSENMCYDFIGLSPNSTLLVLIWFLQHGYESHVQNIDCFRKI